MANYGTFALDQNNKKSRKQHIAKMNNGLGGQKIDETIDRRTYKNHDYTRQKDNIYLVVNEDVCGKFDYEEKKVKDKNFNSDKALKDYIKSTPYYAEKDKWGRTHKIADDAVLCREFVFLFSKEQTERMKPKIKEWAEDNMKFLKKAFPTFEWVLVVVHMHEESPHMQAIGIPFDEKGKLNNKKFFYDDDEKCKNKKLANGRKTMQAKQDLYYEMVLKKYGLERGIKNTDKTHDELTKEEVLLKQSMNSIQTEVQNLENEKQETETKLAKIQTLYDAEESEFCRYKDSVNKGKEKLKAEKEEFETKVNNDIDILQMQLKNISDDLEQKTKEIKEIDKKIEEKNKKMQDDILVDAVIRKLYVINKDGSIATDENGYCLYNDYALKIIQHMTNTELDNAIFKGGCLDAKTAAEDIDIIDYINKHSALRDDLITRARGYEDLSLSEPVPKKQNSGQTVDEESLDRIR